MEKLKATRDPFSWKIRVPYCPECRRKYFKAIDYRDDDKLRVSCKCDKLPDGSNKEFTLTEWQKRCEEVFVNGKDSNEK